MSPPRILVVYDGSTLAERAVDAALERVDPGESVDVLVAFPPRLRRAEQGQFQVPDDEDDGAFVREIVSRAEKRFAEAGVAMNARHVVGPPAATIAREASGYSLVVVGHRPAPPGVKSLAEQIRDRVAAEVLLVGVED